MSEYLECEVDSFGNVYGKPKSLAYAFSLSYNDKQGVVKNTGVQQFIIRLNMDKNVNSKFKFGTKFNVSHVRSDMTQSTGGGRMTMEKLSEVLQLITGSSDVVGFTVAEYLPFDEHRLHKMLSGIKLFTE